MEQQCGTQLSAVKVFFGPSAKVCCYEVKSDFEKHLESFQDKDKVLLRRREKWYLDLPLLNTLQLKAYGLKNEAFHTTYNMCTIGNEAFCSYRRQGSQAERQLTIVALK
jgi:copper oxidase (laccase) domain-containing protein